MVSLEWNVVVLDGLESAWHFLNSAMLLWSCARSWRAAIALIIVKALLATGVISLSSLASLTSCEEFHSAIIVGNYIGRVDGASIFLIAACLNSSVDTDLATLLKVSVAVFCWLSEYYDRNKAGSLVFTEAVVNSNGEPADSGLIAAGSVSQFRISC